MWVHFKVDWCQWSLVFNKIQGRLHLKCDGTCAETRFHLLAKQLSPFKLVGASVLSTTGSSRVPVSGSNAGYTMCEEYWLPTPFASVPFTSPPVRRVPSHFNRNLQENTKYQICASTSDRIMYKLSCCCYDVTEFTLLGTKQKEVTTKYRFDCCVHRWWQNSISKIIRQTQYQEIRLLNKAIDTSLTCSQLWHGHPQWLYILFWMDSSYQPVD
jgi:hypothetical protein